MQPKTEQLLAKSGVEEKIFFQLDLAAHPVGTLAERIDHVICSCRNPASNSQDSNSGDERKEKQLLSVQKGILPTRS